MKERDDLTLEQIEQGVGVALILRFHVVFDPAVDRPPVPPS